jgi:hypothetical protein
MIGHVVCLIAFVGDCVLSFFSRPLAGLDHMVNQLIERNVGKVAPQCSTSRIVQQKMFYFRTRQVLDAV